MVILLWWSLFHNVEITSIVAETYNLNTFPSDFFLFNFPLIYSIYDGRQK